MVINIELIPGPCPHVNYDIIISILSMITNIWALDLRLSESLDSTSYVAVTSRFVFNLAMERKSNIRQVCSVSVITVYAMHHGRPALFIYLSTAKYIIIFFNSKPGSRIGSRSNSRAGSSMTGSSHAHFSRSFLGSKSNLLTASRKNLASESMKFSKPQAQVFSKLLLLR